MRNSRGGTRKCPTSVLSDRNEHFVSSMSNQSYFRTYSSNSGPFSSRLGNSVDPTLQQQLVNFDKTTEELFIRFTQKQRDELNAFDRKWVLENGYELEATSHYLDVRNVEAREDLQRQNEYLIRSRIRSLNSIKKRQKQELQKFYNQRICERNEIIESSEIEPSETVMSVVRNRSGVQVFPKTTSFSQSNSQLSTRTKQIKVDIKKQNSKPSFFFSKTKFEGKDITIGRFKPKKKPKKEEDPNLLDIDNLTRVLNAQNSRYQRIKKEKELDETCKIYEFGELNTPSGMSSAYISATGSSDEISLQSSRTNGSTNIAMSAYDLQVEHFMRQEEKTNQEINDFIEKQDIILQRQIQSSLAKKSPPLLKKTKDNDKNLAQSDQQNIKTNNNLNDNQNMSDEYEDSDSDDDNQNPNNTNNKSNDQNNVYEYEYYSDDKTNSNDNNNDKESNTSQNKLSGMLNSLKPLVDVEVNIFTKGLSSTNSEDALYSDGNEVAQNRTNKQNGRPENNNSVNDDNFNNTSNVKYMKNKNQSNLTTSKKSKTMTNFLPSHTLSMNKSSNDLSNSNSILQNFRQIKFLKDDDKEHLSSGRVKVHKNFKNKNKESSIQISSKSIGEKRRNSNLSNNQHNSAQGKQQFAFRTTLEMGINALSASPIKLDKHVNDD